MIGDFVWWIWEFLKVTFPASKGTFLDFLDDEMDLETNIDGVEFEKSAAGQEFNHQDFTFWFLNF